MQHGLYKRNLRDLLGWGNVTDPASPDTFFRRNMPRLGLADSGGDTNHVALTTQVMTSVAVFLRAGDVISRISWRSGVTAANTPTNYWSALYSAAGTPAKLSQSADKTNTAWAANTTMPFDLAAAQTIPVDGIYWASLMVKATAVPTLLGCIGAPGIVTGEGNLCVSSGSSLTDTAPDTIASPTAKNFVPYVVLT